MTRPLRIGLAGLGRHGERYARHLLAGDVPGAALAAVCRRNADAGAAWADAHGVAYFPDLGALAASPDVDAVALVTPSSTHRDLALAALAARKPLLIEKPLADSVAAAVEVQAAARRAGVPCMIAHTLRREPVYEALAACLANAPAPVRIEHTLCMVPEGESLRSFRGSRLLELGVHILDWVAWARPQAAFRVECTTDAPPPADREFTLFLRAEGLELRSEFRERPERGERIDVATPSGTWTADRIAHTLRADGREAPLPPRRATVAVLLGEFVESLRTGRPPTIPLADGVRAVRLAAAAAESARTGGSAVKVMCAG